MIYRGGNASYRHAAWLKAELAQKLKGMALGYGWPGGTSQPRGGHSANATESTGPGKVPGQGLSFHRNMVFILSNIKDTLLILVCALLKIDPD